MIVKNTERKIEKFDKSNKSKKQNEEFYKDEQRKKISLKKKYFLEIPRHFVLIFSVNNYLNKDLIDFPL